MKRETIIAGATFAAIPVAVISAAMVCTWALAHGASPMWRLPFRLLCHGIARRCLLMWGTPMPICARCTALYVGLFVGITGFPVVAALRERWLRMAMLFSGGLLGIDGLTQLARLRESTNGLRIVTGLAAGLTFGMWVLSAIEGRHRLSGDAP